MTKGILWALKEKLTLCWLFVHCRQVANRDRGAVSRNRVSRYRDLERHRYACGVPTMLIETMSLQSISAVPPKQIPPEHVTPSDLGYLMLDISFSGVCSAPCIFGILI